MRIGSKLGIFLFALFIFTGASAYAQGERATGDDFNGFPYDISVPLIGAISPGNQYYAFIENNALVIKNWHGPVTWVHSSQSDVFSVDDFNTGKYTFTVKDDFPSSGENIIITTDLPENLKTNLKIKSAPLD